MGPEQQPTPHSEAQVAADLAALSARVELLERQVAQLRQSSGETPAPPPPPHRDLAATAEARSAIPVPCSAEEEAASRRESLENRIGSQLFSRIGIIALMISATWFLKLAMDNHWIGPRGRILAGLLAGTGVILWSERFRRQGFKAFSYALKAVGSGVLYLSLWASFQIYHLLPTEAALGAMILVTAWNAYMAWSQDSELLAAYALAGGFATPLLLSTGANHQVFLFTYILAIDVATIVLVRLKPWPRLLLAAFPATVASFIGWYVAFNSPDQFVSSTIFVVLFFLTFASVPVYWEEAASSEQGRPVRAPVRISEVLLPLANAAFGSLALYSLFEDAHYRDLLPWLMVLFAVFYLAIMRLRQSRIASAVHLSLAVMFLTIAIPLKASGRWITIGWLAEGVALLWVSARLSAPSMESTPASVHRVLRLLAIGALLLGFCSLLSSPLWFQPYIATAFLNSRFATELFGVASLAAAAWIALHVRRHVDDASPTWHQVAGASIVAVNLVAILACVRELGTYWSQTPGDPEAELQKALAISAFLMIYGAALLAVGFWKRTAFIRWQALLLIVFTIAKTFLYDMRNLSQGYRVVSFLGLGALLMGVSFAYQKDWLALRDSHAVTQPTTGTDQ
jgi:uncharacterized membrane protein